MLKPDNQKRNNQNGGGPNNKKNFVGLISIILWALILTLLLQSAFSLFEGSDHIEIPYSTFREWVRQDYVESVDVQSNQLVIDLKDGLGAVQKSKDEDVTVIDLTTGEAPAEDWTPPQAGESQSQSGNQLQQSGGLALLTQRSGAYTTAVTAPPFNDFSIIDLLDEHGVEYGTAVVSSSTVILSALVQMVLPFVIMVVAMVLLFRFMSSKMGGGGLGGVGKANAKVYVEKKTGVTFKDVAGQDEAKESLVEIIDFLHNPQKYTEIGAKLPKGALLVGPPGTGKTLLAKAVAGEANVPFFSISGSDFVEMFVGMGAARVRDLFKEASKMAPCIIFIDEIDTIGKSRDNRLGGNDEREQTLNQLLAELDGFDPSKGVIVLGATNRPEVLDKALLRPGRFDRRITIDRPNLAGRLATLHVHTRKIKLAEDVDLKKIALATAGAVGADLANLVNEAALRAVCHGRRLVTQEDLLASFEFVIAGSEKKNSVLTEFEKKLVAYHEVGHAMVAYKQKNAEPVQKITIVPHTEGSLGYTLLMPEEDKTNLRTKEELMAKITVSMGGRAAEEVVLNTMTNGAAQDIQDATSVARSMVVLYGMSDQFGMMALASRRNQYLDGGYGMDCAQDTAAAVDQAVKELLTQCYNQAVQVIRENREDMDKVVAYLLEKETITGAEMVAILEGRDPATADNYPDPDKKEPQQPAPAEQPEASAQEAIPLGEGQAPVQQQEEEQPPADQPPTE